MNFIELAKERTCSRGFTSQNVSDDIITQLLTAAQLAPSAGNIQPWHFYVLKNHNTISNVDKQFFSAKWISSAPVLITVCVDEELSANKYGERGRDLYCIQDTAAAIQNILICAQELGLGACWVGDMYAEGSTTLLYQKYN